MNNVKSEIEELRRELEYLGAIIEERTGNKIAINRALNLLDKTKKRLLADREVLEAHERGLLSGMDRMKEALEEKDKRIKELEKIQCNEDCKIWFRDRRKYEKCIKKLEAGLKERLKPFEELRKECIADIEHMKKGNKRPEDMVDVVLLNMIEYFKKKSLTQKAAEQKQECEFKDGYCVRKKDVKA